MSESKIILDSKLMYDLKNNMYLVLQFLQKGGYVFIAKSKVVKNPSAINQTIHGS